MTLHENSFQVGWLTVTICPKRHEIFHCELKCFKILKKIKKVLILYELPINTCVLDIR